MIKKSIALISAISMLLSFAACGENKEEETTTAKGEEVVATDVITKENGDTEIVTVEKEEENTEDTENEESSENVENSESEENNITEDDAGNTTIGSEDETTKKSDAEKTTKGSNDKTTTKKTTKKPTDKTTTKKSDKTETTKKNEDKKTTKKETTTKKKDSKPSTKKEIIAYYNKAVNKVKSDAKSVVRFYDNSTNYKGIVEAGGLSKIGKLLMDTFLKENHDKVTYEGTSNIVKAFPVEGQKKINITPDVVKSAKCEDKGSYYEITIIADCSDSNPDINPPKAGGVVGKMFNILVPSDITDATDKAGALLDLEGIKYSYMGGEIVARVDKATGNMTYLYTKLPMVLSFSKARALAIVVKNAAIGLQFENKWEIKW